MTYTPLLIFIGIPVFIVMIGRHPVLQKKLISCITWMDGSHNSGKFLSYLTLSLSIGVTTGDFIFVNVLSGYLYGVGRGTILSSFIYGLSLALGSLIELDEVVQEWKTVETMDDVVKQLLEVKDTLTDGEMFELVVLSRLSPIIPETFITMMWNTTNIRQSILWSASILGNVPSFLFYTYLGSLVPHPKHLLSHRYNIKYEYIIGLSLLGLAITYVSHESARYLIQSHRKIRSSKASKDLSI
jgi:uncharacterized membrane protein YdjX (TVP38/TMEM64 family)